ncbi:MAG: hypothetical protein WAO02_04560 [Verrucomicrobiia bacterium]
MNDQELNIASNEAYSVHTNRTFDGHTEEDLKRLLTALVQSQANGLVQPWVKSAIESFENEISRRNHEGMSKALHDLEMIQGKAHHKETMTELENLKASVDQLARPRWIDWAILIVGAIAAIGVVISLFLIH